MTPRTGTDRQPPAHASPRCWADARHYPRYALSVFVVRRAELHVEQLILIVGLQMQNRRQNRQRCQWLRAGAQNGRARGRQHQPCVDRVPDHAVRSVSAQGSDGGCGSGRSERPSPSAPAAASTFPPTSNAAAPTAVTRGSRHRGSPGQNTPATAAS